MRLKGGVKWIDQQKKLPTGDFEVEAVDLSGVTVTDRGLEHFRQVFHQKNQKLKQKQHRDLVVALFTPRRANRVLGSAAALTPLSRLAPLQPAFTPKAQHDFVSPLRVA